MPFTDSAGTRIYWTEQGHGEPLLLVMGLGYTHEMWHRTAPVLSKQFRTILFDNRGVGQSDVPPGPYAIASMADDAAAVLDAAGVERAHVFGISMGGMIAQEFALRHPQRVNKLVLGCTACGGPRAVRAASMVNNVLLNRVNLPPDQLVRAIVPFIYDEHTDPRLIDEDIEIRKRAIPTAEGYLAQLMGILSWRSDDRLANIQAPTLVIHGESDRLVPIGNGEVIAQSIPGAKWVALADASHIFTTDQPEAAHRAVLSFLAER